MVVWFTSGAGDLTQLRQETWFHARPRAPADASMRRARDPRSPPDPSAQRVDGVGAPVQTDTMVGLRRLGREAFFKYPLEILRRNADTIVLELQVQLLTLSLARDLGAHSQYAPFLAGIAHRVRGVDDEVLQDQAQH